MLEVICPLAEGVQIQVKNAEGKRMFSLIVQADATTGTIDVLPRSSCRCKQIAWGELRTNKVLSYASPRNRAVTVEVGKVDA